MKSSTFIFFLLLFFIGFELNAQTKSTITIKTITIQNGDTIVNEETYNSDGSAINFDTLFNDKGSSFLFFNKNFNIDTVFEDNFTERFQNEISKFLQHYSLRDNDLNSIFDNQLKHFSFPDSALNNTMTPDQNGNPGLGITGRDAKFMILVENSPVKGKGSIEDFNIEANETEGTLKISFLLDKKKPSVFELNNSENQNILSEKIFKNHGTFTKLLDMTGFDAGLYTLTLTQGKKQNKSVIIFRKLGY